MFTRFTHFPFHWCRIFWSVELLLFWLKKFLGCEKLFIKPTLKSKGPLAYPALSYKTAVCSSGFCLSLYSKECIHGCNHQFNQINCSKNCKWFGVPNLLVNLWHLPYVTLLQYNPFDRENCSSEYHYCRKIHLACPLFSPFYGQSHPKSKI